MHQKEKLITWFNSVSNFNSLNNLSVKRVQRNQTFKRVLLNELKAQEHDYSKAIYLTFKASVNYINKIDCLYKSCIVKDCLKKVSETRSGVFYCNKCKKDFTEFKWRMILKVS